MKCTIINCDMCGGRIYRDGYLRTEEGTLSIRARQLKYLDRHVGHGLYCEHPDWKRRKYHICPKCVEKLKEYCKSGGVDE